jgi:hypothetical protein
MSRVARPVAVRDRSTGDTRAQCANVQCRQIPGSEPDLANVMRLPGAQSERCDTTLTTVPLGSRSMKRRTPHSSSRSG